MRKVGKYIRNLESHYYNDLTHQWDDVEKGYRANTLARVFLSKNIYPDDAIDAAAIVIDELCGAIPKVRKEDKLKLIGEYQYLINECIYKLKRIKKDLDIDESLTKLIKCDPCDD